MDQPTPPWTKDEPFPQRYFTYDNAKSSWVEQKLGDGIAGTGRGAPVDKIALFSWNIDFGLPCEDERMAKALEHIQALDRQAPETHAPVILLQECVPSDVVMLTKTAWIRERFHLSDLDTSNWANHYGTLTLVDSRLPIKSAFRVHYSLSDMERDAFFTDVSLEGKTVRICNVHLESLRRDPPVRPTQLKVASKFLHDRDVHAGVIAGDFNAIQHFDRELHIHNDLKDAFLELGGQEDTEEGYTWGHQAHPLLREKYGLTRMDKVLYCGGVEVSQFERFGQDVVVEGKAAKELLDLGYEKAYITDHLGVKVQLQIAAGASVCP